MTHTCAVSMISIPRSSRRLSTCKVGRIVSWLVECPPTDVCWAAHLLMYHVLSQAKKLISSVATRLILLRSKRNCLWNVRRYAVLSMIFQLPLRFTSPQKSTGLEEWETEKRRIVEERDSFYDKAVRLGELTEKVCMCVCVCVF